ncbi:sigma-70 RNA polymerase sigma factor region 4 domain-containing protein [Enterococcus massiliensis]|uniref:sigma-70 family RNA polymerase sigma factor n=1 Tax=Enterococcus massiliensis TaxID=1640685 RepID=UPI00065E610F|nr:sigma-70 family RNA polymerase sigma factor [Enterococcus massiliensis]
MTKTDKKREEEIQYFAKKGDWDQVQRLLEQPLENSMRKDRYHKTLSLNYNNEISGEFGDFIADPTPIALELLIHREKISTLNDILEHFSPEEKALLYGSVILEKSYLQLSREFNISDKTIKKRLITLKSTLKEALEK